MAWYVFALVDAVPSARAGRGLGGPLSIRKIAGAFAVVERRADVPPTEFGALKKHQEIVGRLAARVPAILPVRFGTLLEQEDLEEVVREKEDEIAEAFDVVRDRVQFTWRIRGKAVRGARGSSPGADAAIDARANGPLSGAEYLRRAARASGPAPPAAYRALGVALGPLTSRQRYQAATAVTSEALYHLVEKTLVTRYLAAATALKSSDPPLVMSGPWPPFAFAPEVL
jgi:hypothetical protein